MAPEMTTSAKTGACYTGLNGSTVFTEVRTISGLPPLHIRIFLYAVEFCIFSVLARFISMIIRETKSVSLTLMII